LERYPGARWGPAVQRRSDQQTVTTPYPQFYGDDPRHPLENKPDQCERSRCRQIGLRKLNAGMTAGICRLGYLNYAI